MQTIEILVCLCTGTPWNSVSHKRGDVPVYVHDRTEGKKGKEPAKLRLPEPNCTLLMKKQLERVWGSYRDGKTQSEDKKKKAKSTQDG